MAQSVKCPTLAQVIISWFVSSSPVSGSVLTAQSLEPALDSASPSLSAPPLLALCLCLLINKHEEGEGEEVQNLEGIGKFGMKQKNI